MVVREIWICPPRDVKRILLFCLAFGFALYGTRAAVLLSDDFDYTNGPLVSVSGSPWTTYSGTAGQVSVASGRVFLSKNNSEDVHSPLLGAPFTPARQNTGRIVTRCTPAAPTRTITCARPGTNC